MARTTGLSWANPKTGKGKPFLFLYVKLDVKHLIKVKKTIYNHMQYLINCDNNEKYYRCLAPCRLHVPRQPNLDKLLNNFPINHIVLQV